MHYFVRDTFQDTFCTHFTELMPIIYIRRHFCSTSPYWTYYYRTLPGSSETGQFQVPAPKAQDKKLKKHQIQPLSVSPPRDVYLNENQARHMVVIQNDSLPTPSFATQPERKEIPTSSTRQETMTHTNSAADTLVSQVTPLLGSSLVRVPSYKARIHKKTSRKYWAQEHFKGM